MKGATFLVALGRRTPLTYTGRDPLAEAWRFLSEKGETSEGQALRKVMKTLADADGEFAESEVWLFSAKTCALVAALVEARLEGRYSTEKWRKETK